MLKETYEFEIPWRWIPDVQDPGMIMNPPVIPEDEDCSSDIVPVEFTDDSGRKRVYVSELISVTSVFFKRYRLALYTYLNRCLRNGTLAHFVGSRIMNGRIDHTACSFPKVSYWRIDRENFYADVEVELNLNTQAGEKRWKGYLVCWCCFEGAGSSDNRQPGFEAGTPDLVPGRKTVSGLSVTVEELTDQVCRDRSEYDPLNHHLVPYAPNRRVDRIAEQIWEEYLPEALTDPGKRRPEYLAKKMGLSIMYCPVHEHRGVKGIVFFKEDDLYVGEDRVEKTEFGKKRRRKAAVGKPVRIPANTIVINTNKVNREYPAFDIYHECYHYYEHYLFYCLQELASNDFRRVPVKEVVADKEEVVKDSVYFMEKQADRGAMGLMMPVTEFQRIADALSYLVRHDITDAAELRRHERDLKMASEKLSDSIRHSRYRQQEEELAVLKEKRRLNRKELAQVEIIRRLFNQEAERSTKGKRRKLQKHTQITIHRKLFVRTDLEAGYVTRIPGERGQFVLLPEEDTYMYESGEILSAFLYDDKKYPLCDREGNAVGEVTGLELKVHYEDKSRTEEKERRQKAYVF